MGKIRRRLTFANVVSCIALFVALGGASYAATQLPKNSVGTKQLKNNAVVTKKIKKNAVSRAKIRKKAINTARLKANAVTTAKLKNAAVTGAKINAPTTPFSQVTTRLRNASSVPFGTKTLTLVGTYTQPAGELDQFLGQVTINFEPSCTAPREAVAYLILDPADPAKPSLGDIAGVAYVIDPTGASNSTTVSFAPIEGIGAMQSFESESSQDHSLYVFPANFECTSGAGASASNFAIDVLGTK